MKKIALVSRAQPLRRENIYDPLFRYACQRLHELSGCEIVISETLTHSLSSSDTQKVVEELHSYYCDPDIFLILPITGGAYTNRLLPFIDWKLVGSSHALFCGFSDYTVFSNALYLQTRKKSISGSSLLNLYKDKEYQEIGEQEFSRWIQHPSCEPVELWNYHTYYDKFYKSDDHIVADGGICCITPGTAEGVILGGSLSTFSLLWGTSYCVINEPCILFLEEAASVSLAVIERLLYQLVEQPRFSCVQGIVWGRVSKGCEQVGERTLEQILNDFSTHISIPLVMNAQFGHVKPMQFFSIGGKAKINTSTNLYIIDN